jgi:hypothetical protein
MTWISLSGIRRVVVRPNVTFKVAAISLANSGWTDPEKIRNGWYDSGMDISRLTHLNCGLCHPTLFDFFPASLLERKDTCLAYLMVSQE